MTTYRAAIAHGVPLTDESQRSLPEDLLISAAIEEARKPEALGLELGENDITIGDWTD